MKITGFNPLILTLDPENTIKLFEELGFERKHEKDDLEGREDIVGVRLKDSNGFHVDIVTSDKVKQDMVSIRMNVDDFDEALAMLEKHGFKSFSEQPVEDASSKSIGVYAPSGFQIGLVQHIKK